MNDWDRTRCQAEDDCDVTWLGWIAAALAAGAWLVAVAILEMPQ